jgi:hypothetical protein
MFQEVAHCWEPTCPPRSPTQRGCVAGGALVLMCCIKSAYFGAPTERDPIFNDHLALRRLYRDFLTLFWRSNVLDVGCGLQPVLTSEHETYRLLALAQSPRGAGPKNAACGTPPRWAGQR